MIECVGNIYVPGRVDGHTLRSIQRSEPCRTAIAGVVAVRGTGPSSDDPKGVDPTDHAIASVRNVQVSRAIDGQPLGVVEPGVEGRSIIAKEPGLAVPRHALDLAIRSDLPNRAGVLIADEDVA